MICLRRTTSSFEIGKAQKHTIKLRAEKQNNARDMLSILRYPICQRCFPAEANTAKSAKFAWKRAFNACDKVLSILILANINANVIHMARSVEMQDTFVAKKSRFALAREIRL